MVPLLLPETKPVLLSPAANAWKITDFGLTFEGTSRIKYTTQNSRGTQGYRAIELVRVGELGFITKASDIWALGCIFYELAYQVKAFSDDIAAYDYVYNTRTLKGPKPLEMDERTTATTRELIRRNLEVDWWKRPTAKDVLQLLDSLTNQDTSGSVFYISEPDSEAESSNSSNPLERLIDSPPRNSVSAHEDQEAMVNFASTPHEESISRSSDAYPFPSTGVTAISTMATVSEIPHLITLENDDAQWDKADWRSCWYILPSSNEFSWV